MGFGGVVMLRRTLLAAPLVFAATSARAQWVPKQPIKILVGYPPGGTADITARIAADTIRASTATPSSSTTRPAPVASSP